MKFIADKREDAEYPGPNPEEKVTNPADPLAKEKRKGEAGEKQQHEHGEHEEHPEDVEQVRYLKKDFQTRVLPQYQKTVEKVIRRFIPLPGIRRFLKTQP